MSSVPLAKPGSFSGAVLSGGKVGTTGTDFYVKMTDWRPSYRSPRVDLTGDGDDAPCIDNTGYLYGQHTLSGFMVASQAISLLNLVNTSANPVRSLTVNLASGHSTTEDVLIEDIRLGYRRTGGFVGVRILLHKTGTAAGAESLSEVPSA